MLTKPAGLNVEQYFGRETNPATVYRWVHGLTERADDIAKSMKANTGDVWVTDEIVVNVKGKNYWLFNVMDSDSRFVLATYLSPVRTARAAATALSLARERAANAPKKVKTDGLHSYREAVPRTLPTSVVKHVASQDIRSEINNNLSERLQGTMRDRDKTLRAMGDTVMAYMTAAIQDGFLGLGKTPQAACLQLRKRPRPLANLAY